MGTVAVLIAVGVNADGFREVLGVAEALEEDRESWRLFLRRPKERGLKLPQVADRVRGRLEVVLGCMSFPSEHWKRIRSNNLLERVNKEVRRRTRVVGALSDGRRTWMLVSARLRHVASREGKTRPSMNMEHLRALDLEAAEAPANPPDATPRAGYAPTVEAA